MNKRTRIGLMILVTVGLLLSLTIPGLAEKPTAPVDCIMQYPVTHNSNNSVITRNLPGELTIEGWINGTLINLCTGVVPFGEPVDDKGTFTWFEYDDLADLENCEWSEEMATFNTVGDTGRDFVFLWDTDDTIHKATNWEVVIYPNGDFVFTKEYTP